MADKEASARIRINQRLEEAGWRFFDGADGPANVRLEVGVTLKTTDLDALGEEFEKSAKGFVDFLLMDSRGFPLVVLEAKAQHINPLNGKEQARKYARSQNCPFVILSNGNLHYFWDLRHGNPHPITAFPRPESVVGYSKSAPDPRKLVDEPVGDDYIALTQMPGYRAAAAWTNDAERPGFIEANKLRFLRPYQMRAVHAVQSAVRDQADRFLFEMATGTGKTLTAAAVIKLFLRTANARRVLFLVDRVELEMQAERSFKALLRNDFKTVIYKQNRDDWSHAEIVVTTVQSLLVGEKYRRLFSPTDFDLVISDEAHRSIGGDARAVFDHFIGYKLGLTATPRDYLKRSVRSDGAGTDPRDLEQRILLDTYRTFGCESNEPTFRYSLLDGVRDGYLVNPTVIDARTDVTTALLSQQGYIIPVSEETGDDAETAYGKSDFEKRFFSDATNKLFCKTFMKHALRDPVSGEIGKSIIFAVSQPHATKLTQILNQMADVAFPGLYRSDFAVQVTSLVPDAPKFTTDFAYNKLMGTSAVIPGYSTSRARVCVTVGLMTTGYDCTDLLNLGLFRPIFSPTDFIQIKGRGTRKHDFRRDVTDPDLAEAIAEPQKLTFKLFDFFANCRYFEEEFKYDEVIALPPQPTGGGGDGPTPPKPYPPEGAYIHEGDDHLAGVTEQAIGLKGMKIDRMFFDSFEETVQQDPVLVRAVEDDRWEQAEEHVRRNVFGKPHSFFNLDKLRRAAGVDRRLTLREILEKAFGRIPGFKTRDQMLEETFDRFVAEAQPDDPAAVPAIRDFFKAYCTDPTVRDAVDKGAFTALATNPVFPLAAMDRVPRRFRKEVPDYVKDYVSLNQFAL
ncbi:MAG: DEAD/DEAH box helicase family protein [Armatimonadetes bacterium]|nr:DEAD/DEAH box helicase family protein [Armatimonadota bacterium]